MASSKWECILLLRHHERGMGAARSSPRYLWRICRTTAAVAASASELVKNVPKELLIDGKFVAPQSGRTFSVIDPRNEEVRALRLS